MFGWSRSPVTTASERNFSRWSECADVGLEHLDRHRAVDRRLPGRIDDAHPAFADRLQQLVVAIAAVGTSRGKRRARFLMTSRESLCVLGGPPALSEVPGLEASAA